jgi:hypothetical protein
MAICTGRFTCQLLFAVLVLLPISLASIGPTLYTISAESYYEYIMWNVDERFEKNRHLLLRFSVGSTVAWFRWKKYGCGAELRQDNDGRFQMTILPTIMVNRQFSWLRTPVTRNSC